MRELDDEDVDREPPPIDEGEHGQSDEQTAQHRRPQFGLVPYVVGITWTSVLALPGT